MASALVINGRSFIPVVDAAQQVDHAESYIVRLAQERWIDAYQVEGEWFVSLASLSSFLLTAESDVYHHAALASRRRRAVAELAALRAREEMRSAPSLIVVGQMGVVVLCGALVAVLGMSTMGAQLNWQDFQAGVIQTSVRISDSIIVPIQDFTGASDEVTIVRDSSPQVENYYPSLLPALLAEIRSWFR